MVATRSPAGVRHAMAVGSRAGISAARLLAGTDLSEEQLLALDYAIDEDAEFTLTANLLRESGNPVGTGIAVGSRMTVGDLGIWGYALITSATGTEAFAVSVAYVSLAPTFLKPQPISAGDVVSVVLRNEHLPVDVRDYYTARDLSAVPLLLRTAGLDAGSLVIETPFDGDEGAQLRAALHPLEVQTGGSMHALRFPASAMAVPLATADTVTRAACARECERLVHAQSGATALSATIRSRFAKTPNAMPGIDELAAEMHMSTRTLRRQLETEGTSHRALRTEVAQTLAIELLCVVGLSVTEVARRLGYSDTTAFSHAFRRWTGCPAGDYRR